MSPNPCTRLTNVTLGSLLVSPHATLSIYDASGRLVRTLGFSTASFALSTSDLKPGAYFVRVKSGRETRTSRLTVAD
jgi:FAD synthase